MSTLETADSAVAITRSWGEASAICMADRGTLPDDILQVFLPQACRTSRQFLRTSLAEWGLTLCHLLCDTSMARSRAFWEYEVQLATRHSDERHTLANAEAVLGFYVFGLACSGYFVRRDEGPFLGDRVDPDIFDGIMALECAKAHELPEYRACLLSVLAAFEWMAPGDEGHLQALRAFDAQLKALLAMAPARRYRAKGPPTHRHGLTLEGQLDLHTKPLRARLPLLPASTNKEIKLALLASWRDELELRQSLATSDGSWPDELPPLVASSDEDDDWEEDDDKGDAWGSPPSSPRVTPALIARLGDWIASSAQVAKPPRPIFRRILPVFG